MYIFDLNDKVRVSNDIKTNNWFNNCEGTVVDVVVDEEDGTTMYGITLTKLNNTLPYGTDKILYFAGIELELI